jgi:hypothetical protein
MAYITLANANNIVYKGKLDGLDLSGELYKVQIRFFSNYEKSALLAIQELLRDPEKYFDEIYIPFVAKDTFRYIYEGKKPAYHKEVDCERLTSDYENFEIPAAIQEQGPEVVIEFRRWFETVKHLLLKPDVFVARLQLRWGIVTNPKSINHVNSGFAEVENYSIEVVESLIDRTLKDAGRFYYQCSKNTIILKKYSQLTYLAYKEEPLYRNDTGYADVEVKKFLKHYDELFKRPLKRLLIEYYRLKFNPDIKMEGYLLERLGFKPCSYCYEDGYESDVPTSKKDQVITESYDWDDDDDLPF